MIRKFGFKNGDGQHWYLTEKTFKCFLDNPQGLGFTKSIEVTRYGESANLVSENYSFPVINGDILFYDSENVTRYALYNEFVRFIMVKPLTFIYQTPIETYSLKCEITSLQKTESKTDRMLTCPIQISGLEFFNGEEVEIQGTGGTFTIENNSDFAVGFEITIEGGVLTNPYFTLSQNGEIYGEAKFFDSAYFSSVYVNSNDGKQDAILMRGSSVLPNPLSYQDLSIANGSIYVTFVKLARGVSELTVGAESGTIRNVNIKFTPKYRSV